MKDNYPVNGWDAKILITRKCNLRCAFCRIRRDEKIKNELTLEEWKKVFYNLEGIGIKNIQILGGEPTTLPYLEEIIKFLNQETNLFYSIESNSTFDNQRFLSLIKSGIKGYCTDVNTFDFQNKNDWYNIKSNKGYQMLLKMRGAKVSYLEASIILNKKNLSELPFLIRKLSKMNIYSNIIPVHYGNTYNWQFRAENIPEEFKIQKKDSGQVRKILNEIIEMKKSGILIFNDATYFKNLIKINCNPIGWHCQQFPRLRIDADGSLWICNDVKGNIASNFNALKLDKNIYENYKIKWLSDQKRINCPGCAWPIAWPKK